MTHITNMLNQARPFVLLVALLFGVIASWHALAELLPVIKQVWSPRGSAQSMALTGAALAIIAGKS